MDVCGCVCVGVCVCGCVCVGVWVCVGVGAGVGVCVCVCLGKYIMPCSHSGGMHGVFVMYTNKQVQLVDSIGGGVSKCLPPS